jgi:hypothetical protein
MSNKKVIPARNLERLDQVYDSNQWQNKKKSTFLLTLQFCASLTYSFAKKHTSEYVSIRQHTSAYISIRQHASHMLTYADVC